MRALPTATTLAAAAVLAATLAACGSSTPAAVTATTTTPASTTASTTSAATSTASSSRSTTSSETSAASTSSQAQSSASTASTTTTATSSTATTRTETAPAFVGTNPTSDTAAGRDLAAALAVLARHGYQALGTATYDAGDTLRVLIGRQGDSAREQAFFFDQTIYLGTDASTPSEQIALVGHNDTEATLAYGIYRPGASAPSSQVRVQFALDMGQLSAMEPLPALAQRR